MLRVRINHKQPQTTQLHVHRVGYLSWTTPMNLRFLGPHKSFNELWLGILQESGTALGINTILQKCYSLSWCFHDDDGGGNDGGGGQRWPTRPTSNLKSSKMCWELSPDDSEGHGTWTRHWTLHTIRCGSSSKVVPTQSRRFRQVGVLTCACVMACSTRSFRCFLALVTPAYSLIRFLHFHATRQIQLSPSLDFNPNPSVCSYNRLHAETLPINIAV